MTFLLHKKEEWIEKKTNSFYQGIQLMFSYSNIYTWKLSTYSNSAVIATIFDLSSETTMHLYMYILRGLEYSILKKKFDFLKHQEIISDEVLWVRYVKKLVMSF